MPETDPHITELILRLVEEVKGKGDVERALKGAGKAAGDADKALEKYNKSLTAVDKTKNRLYKSTVSLKNAIGTGLHRSFVIVSASIGALAISIKQTGAAMLKFTTTSANAATATTKLSQSYRSLSKTLDTTAFSMRQAAEAISRFQAKGIAEAVLAEKKDVKDALSGLDLLMTRYFGKEGQETIDKAIEGMSGQFDIMGDTLERIGKRFGDFSKMEFGSPQAVADIEALKNELSDMLVVASARGVDAKPALDLINQLERIKMRWQGIGDEASDSAMSLNEAYASIRASIIKVQESLLKAFGPHIKKAVEILTDFISKAASQIEQTWGGISVDEFATKFTNALQWLADVVQNKVIPAITGIVKWLSEWGWKQKLVVGGTLLGWGNVISLFGNLLGVLPGVAKLLWKTGGLAKSAFNAMRGASVAADVAKSASAWSKLGGVLSKVGPVFTAIGTGAKAALTAMTTGMGGILTLAGAIAVGAATVIDRIQGGSWIWEEISAAHEAKEKAMKDIAKIEEIANKRMESDDPLEKLRGQKMSMQAQTQRFAGEHERGIAKQTLGFDQFSDEDKKKIEEMRDAVQPIQDEINKIEKAYKEAIPKELTEEISKIRAEQGKLAKETGGDTKAHIAKQKQLQSQLETLQQQEKIYKKQAMMNIVREKERTGKISTKDAIKEYDKLQKEIDEINKDLGKNKKAASDAASSGGQAAIDAAKKWGELRAQAKQVKEQMDAVRGTVSSLRELMSVFGGQGIEGLMPAGEMIGKTLDTARANLIQSMQVASESLDSAQTMLQSARNAVQDARKDLADAVKSNDKDAEMAAQNKLNTALERQRVEQLNYNTLLGEAADSAKAYEEALFAINSRLEENRKVIGLAKNLQQTELQISEQVYGTAALAVEKRLEYVKTLDKERQNVAAQLGNMQQQIAEQEKLYQNAQKVVKQLESQRQEGEAESADLKKAKQAAQTYEKSAYAARKKALDLENDMKQIQLDQLQNLKELRDGYLDAVQAQAFGAGKFSKIIIDSENNLGVALDKNMVKANYLLGTVGKMAAASDVAPTRFTTQGYGAMQTTTGGPVDVAKLQSEIAKNVADPLAKATVEAASEQFKGVVSGLDESMRTQVDRQIESGNKVIQSQDRLSAATEALINQRMPALGMGGMGKGGPAAGTMAGETLRTGKVDKAINKAMEEAAVPVQKATQQINQGQKETSRVLEALPQGFLGGMLTTIPTDQLSKVVTAEEYENIQKKYGKWTADLLVKLIQQQSKNLNELSNVNDKLLQASIVNTVAVRDENGRISYYLNTLGTDISGFDTRSAEEIETDRAAYRGKVEPLLKQKTELEGQVRQSAQKVNMLTAAPVNAIVRSIEDFGITVDAVQDVGQKLVGAIGNVASGVSNYIAGMLPGAAPAVGGNTPPPTPAAGFAQPVRSVQTNLRELQKRDAEVRAHEQLHYKVAGKFAASRPQYDLQRGPDGKMYAVGGSVEVDTSPIPGKPLSSLAKMYQVRQAALAPSSPSSQDLAIAANLEKDIERTRHQLGYGLTKMFQAPVKTQVREEGRGGGSTRTAKRSTGSGGDGYWSRQMNTVARILVAAGSKIDELETEDSDYATPRQIPNIVAE